MPARFPAKLVEDLWRIRCSTGWAHGSIWTHRRGFELRILWDGRPVWSVADASLTRVRQEARTARHRLERDGFEAVAALEAGSARRRNKR